MSNHNPPETSHLFDGRVKIEWSIETIFKWWGVYEFVAAVALIVRLCVGQTNHGTKWDTDFVTPFRLVEPFIFAFIGPVVLAVCALGVAFLRELPAPVKIKRVKRSKDPERLAYIRDLEQQLGLPGRDFGDGRAMSNDLTRS
jgi:hypothetical protein